MAALPESPVSQNGLRRIMPRSAGDATARMRARPAQIQTLERHPVVGRADHRPRTEQLVEAHLAMEDVPAHQAEPALEVERRMDLAAQHGLGEPRRMSIDCRNDLIRDFLALIVPAPAGAKV